MTTNDSPTDPIQDLTLIVLDMQAQMQAQFEHVATKDDVEALRSAIDGIAARLDIDDTERVALSAQVTRHEDWIVEAAPTAGVPYTPGA